jgi:hypothetical protein
VLIHHESIATQCLIKSLAARVVGMTHRERTGDARHA